MKITHFNGFINSIDSSLLEDQYFNIYMKHKHSNFKRLTSFNERRLLANFLELPLGEDFSKHREPMNMKELIEKTWANWGMGEEKTPEPKKVSKKATPKPKKSDADIASIVDDWDD